MQVISHYQCKEQRDAHRFEKISNIIKQFKLSCRWVVTAMLVSAVYTHTYIHAYLCIYSFIESRSYFFFIPVNLQPLSKAWKCGTPTLRPSSTSSPPTLTSWSSCLIRLFVSSTGCGFPCPCCRAGKCYHSPTYLVFASICRHSHQHSERQEAL